MRVKEVTMVLQNQLPLLPQGARILSDNLAICKDNEKTVFYNASGPIFTYQKGDKISLRMAEAMFCELSLVSPSVLAEALGVHQSTVFRNRNKYQEGGSSALKDRKRSRKPHKLTDDHLPHAQKLLDKGFTNGQIADEFGVVEGTIRHAIKKGRLHKANSISGGKRRTVSLKRPRERSDEDKKCSTGIAVKRNTDRVLASLGKINEAEPQFAAAEAVPMAGVLLGLSALLGQGLLDAGRKVYGSLSNGYFGLRSTLLMLGFMALLRIRTAEQLSGYAPGELGLILGLDRAPEVKTIRRKLREMGERGLASEYASELTRHWVEDDPDRLGYLYVDGHVRPYHGRKHILPKTFVPRRRLCMPATTDIWVNDSNSDPLFHVTAPVNDGLLSMMDEKILPEVRTLVGDSRRVTMIFDREGWSPSIFEKWYRSGFDVLTYRKGKYDDWPDDCFTDVKMKASGKEVTYRLGQRSILLGKKFWMREVRRLCDNGHQTSVMTTRQDIEITEVAERMFARWRQENFFRYMRHEFNLDHLWTYDIEAVDPEQLIANPERKKSKKKLTKLRNDLGKLQRKYAKQVLENSRNNLSNETQKKLEDEIQALEQQCCGLKAIIKGLPEYIAVKDLPVSKKIVAQDRERKVLTDAVKMVAYRAETELVNVIRPFYARHEDEGRKFLKTLFKLPADIVPDKEGQRLVVRLHSMASRRHNKALKALCEVVNSEEVCYPGTDLRIVFDAE